jgi:hypothetical protein
LYHFLNQTNKYGKKYSDQFLEPKKVRNFRKNNAKSESENGVFLDQNGNTTHFPVRQNLPPASLYITCDFYNNTPGSPTRKNSKNSKNYEQYQIPGSPTWEQHSEILSTGANKINQIPGIPISNQQFQIQGSKAPASPTPADKTRENLGSPTWEQQSENQGAAEKTDGLIEKSTNGWASRVSLTESRPQLNNPKGVGRNENFEGQSLREPKQKAQFDALWDAYPSKENREKAHKQFLAMELSSEEVEHIIARVKIFTTTGAWYGMDPQFAPNLARFLYERLWNDDKYLRPRFGQPKAHIRNKLSSFSAEDWDCVPDIAYIQKQRQKQRELAEKLDGLIEKSTNGWASRVSLTEAESRPQTESRPQSQPQLKNPKTESRPQSRPEPENPSPACEREEKRFSSIWEVYPVKENREEAREQFLSMELTGVEVDHITNIVEIFAKYSVFDKFELGPSLARFLSEELWNDKKILREIEKLGGFNNDSYRFARMRTAAWKAWLDTDD